jgi:hypothetical protein
MIGPTSTKRDNPKRAFDSSNQIRSNTELIDDDLSYHHSSSSYGIFSMVSSSSIYGHYYDSRSLTHKLTDKKKTPNKRQVRFVNDSLL